MNNFILLFILISSATLAMEYTQPSVAKHDDEIMVVIDTQTDKKRVSVNDQINPSHCLGDPGKEFSGDKINVETKNVLLYKNYCLDSTLDKDRLVFYSCDKYSISLCCLVTIFGGAMMVALLSGHIF